MKSCYFPRSNVLRNGLMAYLLIQWWLSLVIDGTNYFTSCGFEPVITLHVSQAIYTTCDVWLLSCKTMTTSLIYTLRGIHIQNKFVSLSTYIIHTYTNEQFKSYFIYIASLK